MPLGTTATDAAGRRTAQPPRRRWLRWLLVAVVVLIVLGLAGTCYVAWSASTKLLSLPRLPITGTPARYGLAYQDVSFRSSDGVLLRGWFLPADAHRRAAPVLVLSHGRGQNRAEFLPKLPMFHRAGFALLAFDYRACGESGGTYNTAGFKETRDLITAVSWARRQPGVDPGRVGVVGNSQGAATAILAAAQDRDIDAVVSDSSFASLNQVISYNFAHEAGLPAFPFAAVTVLFAELRGGADVAKVDPAAVIARIAPRRVLLIHGLADTKVRPDQADKLFDHAGAGKSVWLVPGAKHVGAFDVDPAGYQRNVIGFLDLALDVPAAA